MEKALEDLKCALQVAEDCLLQREKRTGIDQTKDGAEKCLSKV